MLNLGVQGFGGRVLRQAQDLAAADARHAASPGDEQGAQGVLRDM